jgi:hypothetical protein
MNPIEERCAIHNGGVTYNGGLPLPSAMLRGGAAYLRDGQFFMVSIRNEPISQPHETFKGAPGP